MWCWCKSLLLLICPVFSVKFIEKGIPVASTSSRVLKCFQLFIHITELLLSIYTAESDEIAHPMNLRTQYPKTVSWNCKRSLTLLQTLFTAGCLQRLEKACPAVNGYCQKKNQRTNGPVNAHLISWPSKAQNIQNLENIWLRNDLDLQYLHTFIISISCLHLPTIRSQATIVSEKSTVFTFSYRKA